MEQRLRKFVIALAILGLVGFALNLAVDNPYTHRLVRTILNEKVQENTNLIVDFKAIKVSVVPPGVDVYGLYLAPAHAPNEALLTASHARARLSVWSLLLGDVRLALVEANDPTVVWPPAFGFPGFLKEDKKAEPAPTEKATWPPNFALPLDAVTLNNAKVYAELPLAEKTPGKPEYFVTSLVGLDIDIGFDNWNVDARITAQSANAAFSASSMLEETAIDIEAALVQGKIDVKKLALKGERLNFNGALTGGLTTSGKDKIFERVNLKVLGDVVGDLSVLGSFLDLPNTRGAVAGQVEVTADVPVEAAGEANFLVEGHAGLTDGYLYGFKLFNSKAQFHITPTEVGLPVVDLIIGDQQYAKIDGVIKLNDKMSFDFHGVPEELRLMDLLDALKIEFDTIDVGITSPDLRVWGQGNPPFTLNVAATGQFTEITLPTTQLDQSKFPDSPACRLDFHLKVTDDGLDFGGSHGNCFQPARGKLAMPGAKNLSPPPDATAVSSLTVDGGVLYAKGADIRIEADEIDVAIAKYFAQVPLSGKGKAHIQLHDPTKKMEIEAAAEIQDLTVANIPFGRVTANANILGTTVKLREARADLGTGGSVTLTEGKLEAGPDDIPLHAKIAARDIGPGGIGRIIKAVAPDVPFDVAVTALDGELEGPARYPFAYKGNLAVQLGLATYEGERLFDRATLTLDNSSGKGWTSKNIRIELGTLAIEGDVKHQRAFPFSLAEAQGSNNAYVQAGLHPDDPVDINLVTKPGPVTAGAKLDHLGTLPFVGKKLRDANISGLIALQAKMTGTCNDLQGTLTGQVKDPSLFGSVIAPINLKGFIKNGLVDVTLDHGGSALEGRISLDVMRPKVPYEWFFNLNRLDLRSIGTSAFHVDPRNFLYVTANWHMKGELTDWWRSTGELDLKDLRGKFVRDVGTQSKTLQIRQEQPVRLLFTDNGWKFQDDKDLYLSGHNVQVRVSMPENKPPERLAIKLESIIDVGILRDLMPQVDTASGKVRIVAEVKGSVSEPKLALEITDLKPNPFIAATWSPVSIGLADVRPALRNVRMRVLYEDGRLVIDSLAADKGTGSITASGSLDFGTSGGGSRIDIALSDATVTYPVAFLKSFEAQISGNVSISGSSVPYKVTGDIEVNRARSTSEVDIRDEIINALRSQSFTGSLRNESPVVVLDLNVTANQSINIHNRNLQAVLSTDLVVRGTDVQPSVLGQVEVDKGKFIYKRDFQIARGLVTFDDPVKPDPTLDILAAAEADNYRVYIAINGRASNPTVEFSVDPPTREDGTTISKVEILVLLSRGKLPEANRSVGQTTTGAATSEAINLIMGQFEEPVEKLFDLSGQNVVRNVYIDTHPSPKGDPVPRLNLPLDLGEDFDVVVRADQSANEVSTEYNVHENITFSGTLESRKREQESSSTQEQQTTGAGSSDADAKVNLKFRFSFE